MADKATRRIRQTQKNMAKELFATSDLLNAFARQLLQADVPQFTPEQLHDLEDDIFGSLLHVRSVRKTVTPIHVKGQSA